MLQVAGVKHSSFVVVNEQVVHGPRMEACATENLPPCRHGIGQSKGRQVCECGSLGETRRVPRALPRLCFSDDLLSYDRKDFFNRQISALGSGPENATHRRARADVYRALQVIVVSQMTLIKAVTHSPALVFSMAVSAGNSAPGRSAARPRARRSNRAAKDLQSSSQYTLFPFRPSPASHPELVE